MRWKPLPSSNRRGNATIELAVTLPLLVTILLGSVETCGHIYAKQATRSAAYECALIAANVSGTNADIQARMTQILTQRGVTGGSVTTSPANIEGLSRGTGITVTVSAPAGSNSMVPMDFFTSDIQSVSVVVKEL